VGKKQKDTVGRRNFLKAAAASGAALVAGTTPSSAQAAAQAPPPTAAAAPASPRVEVGIRHGSDFMVDVFKPLNFEFMAINPHSSSKGLQESVINYGGNRSPELITVLHEEVAVAMSHGYFKIEGKPMASLIYGSVGLQHASMGVYSAFCDRVPVYILLGNELENPDSRSAQDPAQLVRDFTKWDDAPPTLAQFAQSAMRAYTVSMTPPMMPVVLSLDARLQDEHIPGSARLRVPALSLNAPPQGDSGAVTEIARLLVNAEFPVLAVERAARTAKGLQYIIELAELLQSPVVDTIQRMNFPSRHPLSAEGNVMRQADVVLALEQPLLSRNGLKQGAKLISIGTFDLFTRSNYWHFGQYQEADLRVAADAEATLPLLIENVKRLITGDRRRVFAERGAKFADARRQRLESDRRQATAGWDDSPISPARIAAELWEQIKNKDWSLVSRSDGMREWAWRLWDFQKYYHHIGQSGSVGVGYSNPASVGAALANKKHGRLSINLQNDGDMMFLPNTLWTAAHHKIPMLTVMHNNRAYNQEVMWVARTAAERNRDVTTCRIGNEIANPNIDFAKLAQSMGWYAEGPIENPRDLGPAIKRALAVVERGEPALLDTITQPG
jgi:acetolactate synthase I/II/III large subunit